MINKRLIGDWGEDIALNLKKQGVKIIEKNFSCKIGK